MATPANGPTPTSTDETPAGGRRGVGIFLKVLAVALATSLPLIAGVGWILLDRTEAELALSAQRLHLSIVGDVRRAILSRTRQAEEELQGLGWLLLAPGLGDDARRVELVASRIAASGQLDFVTIYAPTGQRVVTIKAEEVADPVQPETLPERVLAGLDDHTLIPGEVLAGEGPVVLELYLPVLVAGRVAGVAHAHLLLDPLDALMSELGEKRLGDPGSVFAVDTARRRVLDGGGGGVVELAGQGIFASAAGDARFDQEFGVAPEFSGREGTPMLGALESVPELGWGIVAQQPQAIAYAAVYRMRRIVLLALGFAALFALGLGILASRNLTRPIRRLVEATRRIGAREFARVDPAIQKRGDEIGELGRSFSRMVLDLEASEEKLLAEARIRDSLTRYLAPEVAEMVIRDPTRLALGGERREVTVLFADVVSFTGLSERLEPERVVALLNELFTIAAEIVHQRGGMVDKFIGDCLMAVWGTPVSAEDDAARALLAASDLCRWVESANRKWKKDFGLELALAIGVNTGPAVAGNLGSERRMEYTVIGDAVNVAARLESLATAKQVLLTEATRLAAGDAIETRRVGSEKLRGRSEETAIYELVT